MSGLGGNLQNGSFISIEGGEGAGKSALTHSLGRKLEEAGFEILITREPGGSTIAESIRSIILSIDNTSMDVRTEALLYAASRRQHLKDKVFPALERGALVLCDRYVDSSLVYQGIGRGIGIDQIWEINRFAIGDCLPDLTLYLDIDPHIGLERIWQNDRREVNRLDLESISFHALVREGFLQIASLFKNRIVTIDATMSPEEIVEKSWAIIEQRVLSLFKA